MTSDLSEFCDVNGVLLRREALVAGIDDNALGRLVRAGVLLRLRQGIYALRSRWLEADERQRHLMLLGGVLRLYDERVVVSHASSVALHGGPLWGLDLTSIHLTRFAGTGRKQSRIVHHRGTLRAGDVTRRDGHWLTAPARCVMEVATVATSEVTLGVANDFLHRKLMTVPDLVVAKEAMVEWPNTIGHHVVTQLADPRVESVGESRSLHMFWRFGMPTPELPWEIRGLDGRTFARVDFAWPQHRLIIEFDGIEKYHRYRRPGETIEQMVMREKRREDRARELTGWTVLRLTWADLAAPEATIARIRRAMSLAA
jgi:hypothetical protein